MPEINKTLAQFGLTPNQTKIYLALLELGEAKVQDISKKAMILRPTTYEVMEQLKEIGLVTQYNKQGVRLYMSEPPKKLHQILVNKQQSISNILPELESMYNIGGFKPKMKYYEGLAGYKTVYEDTLNAKSKQLHGILSMQDMFDKLGEKYMDDYIARRIAAGVHLSVIRIGPQEVKPIWPESPTELRQVRYAPKNFVFPLTMYVYDNKVSLMSSKRENFGLIIESREFMQTQKALFDVLWQTSTKQH